MTHATSFTITPPAGAFEAIAKELRHDQKPENAKPSSRTRRTSYESIIEGTGEKVITVFNEPRQKPKGHPGPPRHSKNVFKKTAADLPSLRATANAAAILIGRRALYSDCLVSEIGDIQLAIIKANLHQLFPSLDDDVLETITAVHCQLETVMFAIYFKFDSETKALKALFDLERQGKITRGYLKDITVKSPKVEAGVVPDEGHHQGITISLPFGQVYASVRRQSNESPGVNSKAIPSAAVDAAMRHLLCIEVEVDLDKFAVKKSNGLTFKFPQDYRLWTKENLPESPREILWKEVLKALRLDGPLATTESEVNLDGLDWMQRQIVEAYLEGKYLRAIDGMPKDSKEILAMRELLASTAHVDIFIPFVIAKLNLSKTLGPKLAFENRFEPRADEVLGHCTLSKKTLPDAEVKLTKRLEANRWTIQRPKGK